MSDHINKHTVSSLNTILPQKKCQGGATSACRYDFSLNARNKQSLPEPPVKPFFHSALVKLGGILIYTSIGLIPGVLFKMVGFTLLGGDIYISIFM